MNKEQIAEFEKFFPCPNHAHFDGVRYEADEPYYYGVDTFVRIQNENLSGWRKGLQHQDKRIAELEAQLAERVSCMKKIRDDLLWRSDETDSDGVKIVELSGSLWVKLNEMIGEGVK